MRLEDYNSKVFTQITENFTVHRRIIYVLLAMCLILLSAIVTNRVTINGQSHRIDRQDREINTLMDRIQDYEEMYFSDTVSVALGDHACHNPVCDSVRAMMP